MPAAANTTPKVSVIIPSYKTATLIARCLDTVMAQTFQDFEAIVVNDGSPDTPELEKVLEQYMDRIVYIKQQNKRCAGARNTAIKASRGEFLAFLDSDDTWYPEHLESQMKQFADDPSLDLVYCDSLLVGDPEREAPFSVRCPSEGEARFETLVTEQCQIPISTVVVRKASIVKAGGFDETIPRCDDYDMWVRTAFHGAKIGYIRKLTVHMYIGRPGSMSQEKAKMIEAYWSILERFKRILPLSEAQRTVVTKRAEVIRARYLVEEGKRQLGQRDFGKARELIAQANAYLHRPSLSLTLFGLNIAPAATCKLISFLGRIRNGASA
ncbi:MAG TPA: glycosyltransferase family A protein [Terriglobales bacterium]|jgi:glycosyltransferase involved in cell wall biosynthesis|nr:glycosyltransferase family A protein [Terriglobales bacterium]